jgi:lysophospholipase L1-like esterase
VSDSRPRERSRSSLLGPLTRLGLATSLVALAAACSNDEGAGERPASPNQGGSGGGGAPAQGGALTKASGGSGPSGGSSPSGGTSNQSGSAGAGGSAQAASGGRGAAPAGGSASGGSPAGGQSMGGGAGVAPSAGAGASAGGTAGQSASGGAGQGGAGTPAVRFVGRMDHSDAAGPKFAWSGCGMIARFKGTSVGVKLNGGQEYAVVVDGAARPKLVPGSGTTSVVTGLQPGEHTVELYRRTEANQGESQFLGFEFSDGELLAPPPAPGRRLEVIGDSITCGYGNEGANMDCPFTPQTENNYLAYASIAARSLGAELSTVAWSGKGVVCNHGDAADSCTNPLPTYYDRILPDRANSAFDFSAFQPDAVVINLGTNDFSTDSDPSQTDFEAAYTTFLLHIRGKYPDAYLLLTNGPMLSGTDLTAVRGSIANVVKARNDAGDTKVGSFPIEPQAAADGYGCDWHPSLATHQKMASVLESALKSALGW